MFEEFFKREKCKMIYMEKSTMSPKDTIKEIAK